MELSFNETVLPSYGATVSFLDDTRDAANLIEFAEFENNGIENFVGSEDTVDWFRINDIEDGSYKFGFDAEDGNLQVALYLDKNGSISTLATFSVNDNSDDTADYIRNVKIADGADLLIKVTQRDEAVNYMITVV